MFLNFRLTFDENLLFLSVSTDFESVHLQHLASHQLVQQVAPFARTRTTNRQVFSLGVTDMYSVCFAKHIFERGVIEIHVLEEPMFGELWGGQGLCVGLDISFIEVVGVGLMTCEEVGVVKRVHLLSGEVRSVTAALKVVEEVQEEVQEIEDE